MYPRKVKFDEILEFVFNFPKFLPASLGSKRVLLFDFVVKDLLSSETFIPISPWKCSQTQIYTWDGSLIQIYRQKHIKCKQTADCKQTAESNHIFLSFLKYYTLEICDMGKAGFG